MKNRLMMFFTVFSVIVVVILIVAYALIGMVFNISETEKFYISLLFALLALTDIIMFLSSYIIIKQKRENIRRSFDHYIEKEISTSGIGSIVFDDDLYIIWASKFVETRIGQVIGKKIFAISNELEKNYNQGIVAFRIEKNGIVFDTTINLEKKYIVLKDITNEAMVLDQYISQKLVIGEIEIDNFSEFQVTLPGEELFKIQSSVIKMLDGLVEKYNAIYRQYVNGKYILFTNQKTLNEFINIDFDFLSEIRNIKVSDGVNLTASIGLGSGAESKKVLTELARDGLLQAQGRGGDQVTLMNGKEKPKYFGSKIERGQTISRVKIKQTTELFEAKLKQKNIKNVIIYGHKFADLDAVGASLGLATIAKHFDKKAFIQNATFDTTATNSMANTLTKDELGLFIKPSKANKETDKNSLVIITDTAEIHRIENEHALRNVELDNVFIFDHHRVSSLPEHISSSNVYINTTASSASEIITEVMSFIRIKIKLKKPVAQMLLNGIYLDTQNFVKSTSARTYQAASFLEKQGAQSLVAAETLKIPPSSSIIISKIISNLIEIKPGYYLAAYEGEVDPDIISKTADEILRTQGRKAAFVVAKLKGQNSFKLSARGIEVNVQKIAEEVGGGGHFAAAAAVTNESLPLFIDNITQAIISDKGVKNEGNINKKM